MLTSMEGWYLALKDPKRHNTGTPEGQVPDPGSEVIDLTM